MVRKTMKMLVVTLVAAFALSSMAEAAPKKMVRHRAKHSSRVASGADITTAREPAAKKKSPGARSRTRALANKSAHKPALDKAPAKHRTSTKPR